MTTSCATGCTRPVRDGLRLCDDGEHSCGHDLEVALGDVTAHHADLEATLAKQRAIGDRNDGGRSAEHPLPIHVGAMRARSTLRAVLAGWVRDIAETHDAELPADDEPAMSRWLLARRLTLLAHPAAEEIHREVIDAVDRIKRVVDRPPDLVLVGRCDADCGQSLYAERHAIAVGCEACGTGHQVNERKDAMRAELADTLMTAGEIARLAATFTDLPYQRVRNLLDVWQHRARIVPVTRLRGKPAYPFGPTLEQVLTATRQAA